mmetsp:Transcript_75066/g.169973  ORF Transcript_75066/g.169973 Transcript_75066/m.169973 type:complete len:214 (+) Transcript_75066:78-719(+)
MLLLRARQQALARLGARGISSSVARLGGSPPFLHLPPPPPPEFEPDGSPKKYPLHQPIWDHGYEWEHWALLPAGVFHTVYYGDFAQDYPPYWAWLQKFPMWVVTPYLVLWALTTMVIFQNMGSIGIKPKRYTIEWIQATKERERLENTNPVTRYLDRPPTGGGGGGGGGGTGRRKHALRTWTEGARTWLAAAQRTAERAHYCRLLLDAPAPLP